MIDIVDWTWLNIDTARDRAGIGHHRRQMVHRVAAGTRGDDSTRHDNRSTTDQPNTTLKPSAQWNETETKQFQETVSKHIWNCFVSVAFRCADGLTHTATQHTISKQHPVYKKTQTAISLTHWWSSILSMQQISALSELKMMTMTTASFKQSFGLTLSSTPTPWAL